MRKQLLGILVPLTAFVIITTAVAADMTGKGVAASAALQKLEVAHRQDGLRVEFKAKGPLAPKLTTLDSPARIVVDFPNTVMATAQSRINVGSDGVKDVRVGMDGLVPPSTRVVIDLASGSSGQHELTAAADGTYVLTIHDTVVARRATAPVVKPVAASSSTFANTGTSVAPQLTLASAPAASIPAPIVLPAAPAVPNVPKAVDVALVEPTFSVKDDKATAPAAKADQAASRFADKTAAELVATTANASMGQSGSSAPTITPAVNLAAEQKVQMEQKPAANGAKYTGEPISVNLKDVDLKDFFRLIHEISGLNVVLDPQIHGTLTIVLDDVPWDQALDIVLKNNDLSRQLDGNVLPSQPSTLFAKKQRIAALRSMPKHWQSIRSASRASSATLMPRISCCRSRSS